MSTFELVVEDEVITALFDTDPVELVLEVSSTELVLEQEVIELVIEDDSLNELVIEVPGPQGPQGEQGIPGLPGDASVGAAEFNFAIQSDTWVAVHNLGFTPNVECMIDGKSGRGVVTENNATRTVVSYYLPVAGRMILS